MKLVLISTINGKSDEGMKNVANGISFGLRNINGIELIHLMPKDVLKVAKLRLIKKSDRVIVCLRANKRVYNFLKIIYLFNKNISFVFCQPATNDFIKLISKKNLLSKNLTLNDKLSFLTDYMTITYHVDEIKFFHAQEKKEFNRVLSVGHLTEGRNIMDIISINDSFKKTFITSIDNNEKIKHLLEEHGVNVVDEYIPNIGEIYRTHDIYFFPTIDLDYVIFVPLSVLEAAACGLPIVLNSSFPCLDLLKKYISNDALFCYQDVESLNKAISKAFQFVRSGMVNNLSLNSSWIDEGYKIIQFLRGNRHDC